jgi:hypothetical protein
VGIGGVGQLFTGSVANSTGLTTLIGSSSGRFRYNSDESITNYSTVLTSGLNAIYREQPLLTVQTNSDAKVYNRVAYNGGNGGVSSGYVNGDTAAILTGGLSYGGSAQGAVNAGSYSISSGGYSNGLGYALTYLNGGLTVFPAPMTITANAQTKIYGAIDPSLTYSVVGLVSGDNLSGSLWRTAIENVGSYPIENHLDAGSNYVVTYQPADFSITAATLSIMANSKAKIYGETDVPLDYLATGFKFADSVSLMTGKLKRLAGEEVGKYAISDDGLNAGKNYTIAFTGSELAITPASLSIVANPQTKIYGETDVPLDYLATGFKFADSVSLMTGKLKRLAGEEVGK